MSTSAKPTIYSFTLFFSGIDVLDDARLNALFEGGCDDALFGTRDGAQYGAFDRAAGSFSEALASAVRDVTAATTGLQVVRVEPDELVTLASIAERSGLSREYIRLLSANKRGPGGFPAPVTYADHKTRLWHWPDVAHWLAEHEKAKVDVDTHAADLIAALNAALEAHAKAQSPHRKGPLRQDSLLEIGGNSRRNLLGDAVSRLGSMFCSVLECITKCNKYRKLNDAFAFS